MIKYIIGGLRAIFPIIFGCIKCSYMSHHKDKYPLEVRYAKARRLAIYVNRCFRAHLIIENKQIVDDNHQHGRIYICNHQTVFDILAMFELSERPITFISKKENKKVPFLNVVSNCIDTLYIDRNDVRQSIKICKQAAELALNENRDIVLFPEGTRSKDGRVHEFRSALISLVSNSKVEVVMVCLYNSKGPLKFRFIKYPKEYVKVKVFEPLSYEYFLENKKTFAEYTRNAIQEQYDLYDKERNK